MNPRRRVRDMLVKWACLLLRLADVAEFIERADGTIFWAGNEEAHLGGWHYKRRDGRLVPIESVSSETLKRAPIKSFVWD